MKIGSDIAARFDLHTHTTYSDGALTTRELMLRARESGLTTIAISDHDTVSALDEAREYSEQIGLGVIPGIEITTGYKRYQLHFLGYFIDYANKKFLARLNELRDARVLRAKRIIAKLNRIKIPLKLESVMERAGAQNSIGRPHIANTMVEEGLAGSYDEVFHKYIGIGKPAYEANHPFPPEEAIRMVSEAGGLSFLAHPSHYVNTDMLHQLLKAGLDGVEVIHPSHSPEESVFYNKFADENSLLKSGGSDFHGGLKNDDANIGKYYVGQDWLEAMYAKIGKRVIE
ncbi:MAG: PHP domain-containing protein [Bacteroidetes bacterium]|nr:PHP domain-containing protein [Bacteroidota bacterium]